MKKYAGNLKSPQLDPLDYQVIEESLGMTKKISAKAYDMLPGPDRDGEDGKALKALIVRSSRILVKIKILKNEDFRN